MNLFACLATEPRNGALMILTLEYPMLAQDEVFGTLRDPISTAINGPTAQRTASKEKEERALLSRVPGLEDLGSTSLTVVREMRQRPEFHPENIGSNDDPASFPASVQVTLEGIAGLASKEVKARLISLECKLEQRGATLDYSLRWMPGPERCGWMVAARNFGEWRRSMAPAMCDTVRDHERSDGRLFGRTDY
jgi:hypothetical protein